MWSDCFLWWRWTWKITNSLPQPHCCGESIPPTISASKLFIAKPIRGLGLRSRMVDELVLLADRENLNWLKAEVVTNHGQMIKALRNKGFEMRAALEDFFMSKDGITQKRWQIWKYIVDVNWSYYSERKID